MNGTLWLFASLPIKGCAARSSLATQPRPSLPGSNAVDAGLIEANALDPKVLQDLAALPRDARGRQLRAGEASGRNPSAFLVGRHLALPRRRRPPSRPRRAHRGLRPSGAPAPMAWRWTRRSRSGRRGRVLAGRRRRERARGGSPSRFGRREAPRGPAPAPPPRSRASPRAAPDAVTSRVPQKRTRCSPLADGPRGQPEPRPAAGRAAPDLRAACGGAWPDRAARSNLGFLRAAATLNGGGGERDEKLEPRCALIQLDACRCSAPTPFLLRCRD